MNYMNLLPIYVTSTAPMSLSVSFLPVSQAAREPADEARRAGAGGGGQGDQGEAAVDYGPLCAQRSAGLEALVQRLPQAARRLAAHRPPPSFLSKRWATTPCSDSDNIARTMSC